jgi:hypothetical protein
MADPSNLSFLQQAWDGNYDTHIFPWLSGFHRTRNDISSIFGQVFQEYWTVGGHSDRLLAIDSYGGYGSGVQTQILDVYHSNSYTQLEGWAPRIWLKDENATNSGIYNGELNNPWSGSGPHWKGPRGYTLPFRFNNVYPLMHQNSTGIGFVLRNHLTTGDVGEIYTSYSDTPLLNACTNRPLFQQAGPPITWKMTVRCCRYYDIDKTKMLNGTSPGDFEEDQGQTCQVDIFLFGVNASGEAHFPAVTTPGTDSALYFNSNASSGQRVYGNTIADKGTGATYYWTRAEVPYLYEGLNGGTFDYGSYKAITSNVNIDTGVAGGYATYGGFVQPATHQTQFDEAMAQLTGSGWTEITMYAQFELNSAIEGIQMRVDNNTPGSSLLVDYVSLKPCDISVGNLYATNTLAYYPRIDESLPHINFSHPSYANKYNTEISDNWYQQTSQLDYLKTGGRNQYSGAPTNWSFKYEQKAGP